MEHEVMWLLYTSVDGIVEFEELYRTYEEAFAAESFHNRNSGDPDEIEYYIDEITVK